jgi:hypothetical protein
MLSPRSWSRRAVDHAAELVVSAAERDGSRLPSAATAQPRGELTRTGTIPTIHEPI